MGGKNNCCRIDGCPTPPELELEGLEQIGDWFELSDCCYRARFDYNTPINNVRYTGPIYQSLEFEHKGRITYKGLIGTLTSSYGTTECTGETQQDVGYKERWRYGGEQWRKFAIYSINPTVTVYAHRVVITELGLPVAYWYYRIDQSYSGTRGWERKTFASLDNTIYVPTTCTQWLDGSGNTPPSTYGTPTPGTDWTETLFASFTANTKTYFKIKEEDLLALDPEEWLETEISSEDPNLAPSSTCTPGTQEPVVIAYATGRLVACSTLNLSIVSLGGPSCNTQIRSGTSSLFLDGGQAGRYFFNFNLVLMLINSCCIDLDSACSWDLNPGLFWWWDHEARIDINNCTESFNPYDIVLHGVFDVRVKLPV